MGSLRQSQGVGSLVLTPIWKPQEILTDVCELLLVLEALCAPVFIRRDEYAVYPLP